MDRYSVNLAWSDEDGGYIATVPEFENLEAFGESREEALTEARTVIELYLETLAQEGLEPPKPRKRTTFSGQLRIRIAKTLHQKLAAEAEREGISLNSFIAHLLSQNYAFHAVERIQRVAWAGGASYGVLAEASEESANKSFDVKRTPPQWDSEPPVGTLLFEHPVLMAEQRGYVQ